MTTIKDMCKILDCYGVKILYNGFDNTIAELDRELQESMKDKKAFTLMNVLQKFYVTMILKI